MNFIRYQSSLEPWTNHFLLDKNKKRSGGLNIIKASTQTGAGALKIITPTDEVVRRAKATKKRVRKQRNITVKKKKRNNSSTKKKVNSKKKVKRKSKK